MRALVSQHSRLSPYASTMFAGAHHDGANHITRTLRVCTQNGHGKQALSTKATAASCGIGTEQRKGLAIKSSVPGPGKYKARSRHATVAHVHSRAHLHALKSYHAHLVSRPTRAILHDPDVLLRLQLREALGEQVESLKHNASKPVFGSGSRAQREKVYQDAESEKTYYGRLSPGPCAYDSKVRYSHVADARPLQISTLFPAVMRSFLLSWPALRIAALRKAVTATPHGLTCCVCARV